MLCKGEGNPWGCSTSSSRRRRGLSQITRSAVQGMAPTKTWKPGVIPIGCDPFTAGLDRKRCEVGIRYEISAGIGVFAEAVEDVPMARSWLDADAVGQSFQSTSEDDLDFGGSRAVCQLLPARRVDPVTALRQKQRK